MVLTMRIISGLGERQYSWLLRLPAAWAMLTFSCRPIDGMQTAGQKRRLDVILFAETT